MYTSLLPDLVINLIKAIEQRQVDVNNAYQIIVKGMELIDAVPGLRGEKKKDLIVSLIKAVAGGKDRIQGTPDDLIPEKTVQQLELLLKENMIEDTIQVVIDATKGKFDINRANKLLSLFHKMCCASGKL
jgi:hypothetical protein